MSFLGVIGMIIVASKRAFVPPPLSEVSSAEPFFAGRLNFLNAYATVQPGKFLRAEKIERTVEGYLVVNNYGSYIRSAYTSIKNGSYTTRGEVKTWDDIMEGTKAPHGFAEYEGTGSIHVQFTDGTTEHFANYKLDRGEMILHFVTDWRPPGAEFTSV